ncbi:MAG: hypothetical protein PHQ30_01855 [Candidatus Izemoplasmatales bacterium]|nr:hypothetical protein [Candidatus Izemoplasmatales bacterium]
MPIIEAIKIAEAQAEEYRREAMEQVRLLMDETKALTESTVAKMMEAAVDEEKQIQLTVQKAIEAKRLEIFARVDAEDDKLIDSAKKKEKQTVDFILGKVIEL